MYAKRLDCGRFVWPQTVDGVRSERSARLLDQMEFQMEELLASATEGELAAEAAATKTSHVAALTRNRPARGSSSPTLRNAVAAVARVWPSWGKTSPRHWK